MAVKTYAGGALFGERYRASETDAGRRPDVTGASDPSPGPTVVAMHGWGRCRADFAQVLSGLDAVALDLPGFGASPPPSEGVGAAWYAQQVVPVFESMPGPSVIVGHSFGGRVGVMLAATRPDLVAALVLVGVPLLHRADRQVRKAPLGYRLVKLANRVGVLSDALLESARKKYGSADYAAAQGVMRDVLIRVVNETYEEQLAAIDVPVRLVWGADDTEVPVEVAERAADMLGQAELDVVDGVGHHVPLVAPDAIRRAVDSILK